MAGGLLPNRTGLLPGRAGVNPGRGCGGGTVCESGYVRAIASYSGITPDEFCPNGCNSLNKSFAFENIVHAQRYCRWGRGESSGFGCGRILRMHFTVYLPGYYSPNDFQIDPGPISPTEFEVEVSMEMLHTLFEDRNFLVFAKIVENHSAFYGFGPEDLQTTYDEGFCHFENASVAVNLSR